MVPWKNLIVDDINKLSTNNDIHLLYYWNHNNLVIKCYGYYMSDNSIISKHKLPAGGISDMQLMMIHIHMIYMEIYI